MADLVGVFAASHTPVMLNFPELISAEEREDVLQAFRNLGKQLRAVHADSLIIISDDHLHNFFLNNFPAFCIGATDRYLTPVEHWLKAPRRELRGDVALGAHLLAEALESDFDPSFSMDLTLDHGTLTPLELSGFADDVGIVPILVNCVQPPLPTMRRALQWGQFLRTAVQRFSGVQRVAILATGGLSHDVGTPRMGIVDERFDREFLDSLRQSDRSAAVRYAQANVDRAGNGTEEVRTWLMAHGAAGQAHFEVLYYRAVAKWYAGIGIGQWRVDSA
jgi:aromatic ring-opening dioxygenase catalytic subunit (LigB family)